MPMVNILMESDRLWLSIRNICCLQRIWIWNYFHICISMSNCRYLWWVNGLWVSEVKRHGVSICRVLNWKRSGARWG
uniref:Uncharacterized protein n=1 Tax=Picea glauca TaxID=3330 RepID=A0A117NGX1_PICGL|nr:hypothetical protein ABT39_MTgene5681 [Picea glauca]